MTEVRCAWCRATGEDRYTSGPCQVCHGAGTLTLTFDNGVPCAYCRGTGEDRYNAKPCQVCRGAAVIAPTLHV